MSTYNPTEEWSISNPPSPTHPRVRDYARLLAAAYLAAPLEHEGEIERLLNDVCEWHGMSPSVIVESVGAEDR